MNKKTNYSIVKFQKKTNSRLTSTISVTPTETQFDLLLLEKTETET